MTSNICCFISSHLSLYQYNIFVGFVIQFSLSVSIAVLMNVVIGFKPVTFAGRLRVVLHMPQPQFLL